MTSFPTIGKLRLLDHLPTIRVAVPAFQMPKLRAAPPTARPGVSLQEAQDMLNHLLVNGDREAGLSDSECEELRLNARLRKALYS